MNFLIPLGLLAVSAVVAVAGFRAAKQADDEYQIVLDETDEAIQAELKRLEQPTVERLLKVSVRSLLLGTDLLGPESFPKEPRDVKTLSLFASGAGAR
jgi:hypothetical protein